MPSCLIPKQIAYIFFLPSTSILQKIKNQGIHKCHRFDIYYFKIIKIRLVIADILHLEYIYRMLLKIGLTQKKFNPVSISLKFALILFSIVILGTNSYSQTVKKTRNNSNMENTNGTTITLGGQPIHTVGKLPSTGTQAKDFSLTNMELKEETLANYKGKYIIMNIFPSVNTGVCSKSVRKFNEDAAGMKNTVVLCISKDLPFAQKLFCGAEGIDHVVMLSDFRSDFGTEYGVMIADGAFKGLLSRAVIVINPEGKIVYEEQVPEIGQEPDYTAAINTIK